MNRRILQLNLPAVVRLLLLLLTLSLSTVFVFIPQTEPKDYFIFSDQKLTLATHMFFLFEHLILVMLAVALYIDSKEYKNAFFIYIIIQSLDTLIYLLAYGNFGFTHIPITWNWIKVLVFGIVIVNSYERDKRKDSTA